MNIEEIREYSLSLPLTSEDMAFGEECLLLRVCDKIFVCLGLERQNYFTLKCDEEYATELRAQYPEIMPAWHWNKRYWNQIDLNGKLPDEFIRALIRHSYSEVVKKLPKQIKALNPELLTII